jgi:hypothetical protein
MIRLGCFLEQAVDLYLGLAETVGSFVWRGGDE